MPLIKSFHSAPHSIVQSAITAALKRSSIAPDVASSASGLRGIATQAALVQQATDTLRTMPHPRLALPVQTVARMADTATAKPGAVRSTPLGAPKADVTGYLATMLRYAWLRIQGKTTEADELASDFFKSSGDDGGWLNAAFHYLASEIDFPEKIQYVPAASDDSFCYSLPEQDKFRIGILGDWGTGEPVAQAVVNAMIQSDIDLMIHVGDVYYAGTTDEAADNYISMIDKARAQSPVHGSAPTLNIPIYNMPGNHDYYTKGKPFYDTIAKANCDTAFPSTRSPAAPVPTPAIQEASFWVLRNSWLQLQAMDTGYYDSDLFAVANDTTQLHDEECAWHKAQFAVAEKAALATFLFSHHQAWSRFLGIGVGPGTAGGLSIGRQATGSFNPNLQRQLADVPTGVVRAWFWGHEHVLEVYDAEAIAASKVKIGYTEDGAAAKVALSDLFPWVPYSACIGYSAFPMLQSDNPYGNPDPDSDPPVNGPPEPDIQCNANYRVNLTAAEGMTVYNHGFTILEVTKVDGGRPTATATYYSVPSGQLPTGEPTSYATAFPTSLIP